MAVAQAGRGPRGVEEEEGAPAPAGEPGAAAEAGVVELPVGVGHPPACPTRARPVGWLGRGWDGVKQVAQRGGWRGVCLVGF